MVQPRGFYAERYGDVYKRQEYDLSRIPLLARDQHGNPCGIPSDIEWTLADTNQTNATIENGKLLVAVGSVPDACLLYTSPAMRRTSFARRWRSYRHGSSFLRRSIHR